MSVILVMEILGITLAIVIDSQSTQTHSELINITLEKARDLKKVPLLHQKKQFNSI